MRLEMNLLENSYDFFYDSLDLYPVADEYGTHETKISNPENKKKWKTAFIFMHQAIELLIKEGLAQINGALVLDNIDMPMSDNNKVVAFSKSLIRINNFKGNVLTKEEVVFLKSCADIRNAYIHNIVVISSPELKIKYCKLFAIYLDLHQKLIPHDINYKEQKYGLIAKEIVQFDSGYTIFRGMEIPKDSLEEFKEEIELNKKHIYYIDKEGKLYLRIKFGEEKKALIESGHEELVSSSYDDFEYCQDCGAKKGELHLDACDWEVCPVCFGQALSCDCVVNLADNQGRVYKSPYAMK